MPEIFERRSERSMLEGVMLRARRHLHAENRLGCRDRPSAFACTSYLISGGCVLCGDPEAQCSEQYEIVRRGDAHA